MMVIKKKISSRISLDAIQGYLDTQKETTFYLTNQDEINREEVLNLKVLKSLKISLNLV
jgi:hypothetical protein